MSFNSRDNSTSVNRIQLEREICVKKCIPDLFSGKFKTVLYVGANKKRQHFLKYFEESNCEKIVVMEAFPENAEFLKQKFEGSKIQVIEGDVREIEKFDMPKFDVIFFWHGIEHLQMDEIEDTLKKLESKANSLIVLGMPYGHYLQGPEYGNPYEEHQSAIYPPMLENFGYSTEVLGKPDEVGSNLTAWKYLKKNNV